MNRIKRICYYITRIIFRILFCLFPLEKKVFFSSFSGKCYADNPKYISQKLHEMYPEYKQVWAQYKGYEFNTPDYIKVVRWGSIQMMYEMATSKIWVNSHLIRLWMPKRKGQYFIETWHGGLGLKKIEGDIKDKLSPTEIKTGEYSLKNTDLLISNSKFLTKIYRRAFWGYQGEILECGYPKSDMFYKNTDFIEKRTKKKLNIPGQGKIILYAPTFRENKSVDLFKLDYEKIRMVLERRTGQEWYFLLRLHPVLKQFSNQLPLNGSRIIDVSSYNDMQELIATADIFLTDYSSSIFDFAQLRRFGLLYVPDIEKYSKDRGLYFNIYELPFPVAQTQEELLQILQTYDVQEYETKVNDFFEKMGLVETSDAAKIVCDRIKKEMECKYQ